jgi:hypothetical protein
VAFFAVAFFAVAFFAVVLVVLVAGDSRAVFAGVRFAVLFAVPVRFEAADVRAPVVFVAARFAVAARAVTLRAREVAAAQTRPPAPSSVPARSARAATVGRSTRPIRPTAAITVDHPFIDQAHSPANRVGRSSCRKRRFEVSDVCSKGGQLYGPRQPFSNSRAVVTGPAISSARDDEDE